MTTKTAPFLSREVSAKKHRALPLRCGCARGSRSRSLRSYGRVPHTSYVFLTHTSGDTSFFLSGPYHRSSLLPSFSLTRRPFTSLARHQSSSSCTAFTRLRGGASPQPSLKASLFRSVAVFLLFSSIIVSLRVISSSALNSLKSHCRILRSLITRHSSCSPSLSAVLVTSFSSIACRHFSPPFTRTCTDDEIRFIVLMRQLYKIDLTPSCFHLDLPSTFSFAHIKQSLYHLLPSYLYQIGPCTAYLP